LTQICQTNLEGAGEERRMRKWETAVMIAILMLSGRTARAQVITATIYGSVSDPVGASVPGATVALHHQQTGATITKVSGDTGDFQFDFLRVGTYTITIEAKGFKRYQSSGI